MLLNLFCSMSFIMLCSWLLVTYNRRAGLVDVAWSFSIALNVIIAAWAIDSAPMLVPLISGTGEWDLVFTADLASVRRYANETQEDTRYANMRRAMGIISILVFWPFYISGRFGATVFFQC